MPLPRRAAQIVDTLPTLYFQDAVSRRVIDALASRLAVGQLDLLEVMNSHWVDTADDPLTASQQRPVDLARIAALVPLAPFPDEEAARLQPDTVLIDASTVMVGPRDGPLSAADLVVGQRLFVGGTRTPDGSLLAQRVSVVDLADPFDAVVSGRVSEVTPATVVDPTARLVLLTGRSGSDMFRQRLKLTVEAFLEGAGTAPAILKMTAATMGWGRLRGTFVDWSASWTRSDPVFEAVAEGAPAPIRLRELPLRLATTSIPHRVKAGGRWLETNTSTVVAEPSIQFRALDQPIVIPTLVNLDAHVAVAALVVMETIKIVAGETVTQEVELRIQAQPDGSLRGTLFERPLPSGAVVETDITDRIRVSTSGLRIDRPEASAFLSGGSDERPATLVISNGQRAIRLAARGEGIWANGVRVSRGSTALIELRYDPALAIGGAPSPEANVFVESLSLDDVLAGRSRLVEARDISFTIPDGRSQWLYFDHVGWAVFDTTQWDRAVFDDPPPTPEDPGAILSDYPAKGIYDYTLFAQTVFPQEFLRAFRFDGPGSTYDNAFFNDTPEQVEVLLGWLEGQRATIRLDVPLASVADRQRLAFLPDMVRRVKAAGIKVVLVPRFPEAQSLGERGPSIGVRLPEAQPLGENEARAGGVRVRETQQLGSRVIGLFDNAEWNAAHFDTQGQGP
jgi:hypothetical protein